MYESIEHVANFYQFCIIQFTLSELVFHGVSKCFPLVVSVSSPRGMMVIRELSVLLNVLCSPSRAEIVFSKWARLPGPAVSGWTPALRPVVRVLVLAVSLILVVPATPAAFVLRSQCFRYWLGVSAEDFSGAADA